MIVKPDIRIIGFDDAPFNFSDEFTDIIGVIIRGKGYLEGVLHDSIKIDGDDVTSTCQKMILGTRYYQQLKAILLDGITMGGFNIIDIESLWNQTKIPVITITRERPNLDTIRRALQKHFSDWRQRFELLNKNTLVEIETKHNPIYVSFKGISLSKAKEIITLSTIRGVIPEPLRVAHVIASGISRGESYGKA